MSEGPGNGTILRQWMEEVYEVNVANGWFEAERSLDDEVALLHSEVSEMLEAYRSWGMDDVTEQECKKPGALTHRDDGQHLCKPEGVGSEVADVLIRLLDFSTRHDLDVDIVVNRAECLSFAAPDGFSAVVNWLHREVGDLIGAPSEYRAGRVLRVLQVACSEWGLSLSAEYTRKIAFNRTRGHRHGGKRL